MSSNAEDGHVQSLQQQLEELTSLLQTSLEERDEAQAKEQRIKKEVAEEKREMRANMMRMQLQLNESKQKVAELEQQLRVTVSQVPSPAVAASPQSHDVALLRHRLSTRESDLLHAQRQLRACRLELVSMSQLMHEQSGRHANEVESERNRSKDLHAELEQSRAEIERMREMLKQGGASKFAYMDTSTLDIDEAARIQYEEREQQLRTSYEQTIEQMTKQFQQSIQQTQQSYTQAIQQMQEQIQKTSQQLQTATQELVTLKAVHAQCSTQAQ